MVRLKSTLTSKGQITLPKTVREVLNLNLGDQVTFDVQFDGTVLMAKGLNVGEEVYLYNLLSFIIDNSQDPIVVTGGIAVGKTRFVKSWITNIIEAGRVGIIDPGSEYNQFVEAFNEISLIDLNVVSDENDYREKLSLIDTLVIDEAQVIDFARIQLAHKMGKKLIIISQRMSSTKLKPLGDYFLVHVGSTAISIDQFKLRDNEYKCSGIYHTRSGNSAVFEE